MALPLQNRINLRVLKTHRQNICAIIKSPHMVSSMVLQMYVLFSIWNSFSYTRIGGWGWMIQNVSKSIHLPWISILRLSVRIFRFVTLLFSSLRFWRMESLFLWIQYNYRCQISLSFPLEFPFNHELLVLMIYPNNWILRIFYFWGHIKLSLNMVHQI